MSYPTKPNMMHRCHVQLLTFAPPAFFPEPTSGRKMPDCRWSTGQIGGAAIKKQQAMELCRGRRFPLGHRHGFF
jgi:hypothetical protein